MPPSSRYPSPVVPPPRPTSSHGGNLFGLFLVVILSAVAGTIGYSLGNFRSTTVILAASASACPPAPVASPPPLPDATVVSSAPAPSPTMNATVVRADDLVRMSVGRWRSADGKTTIEVDPPSPQPGKAPPYRLVVRAPALPRSGFGCEFAQGDERHGPGDVTYFKAWCGKGKQSTLGLGMTGEGQARSLSVLVLQDGDVRVHVDGQRVPATD